MIKKLLLILSIVSPALHAMHRGHETPDIENQLANMHTQQEKMLQILEKLELKIDTLGNKVDKIEDNAKLFTAAINTQAITNSQSAITNSQSAYKNIMQEFKNVHHAIDITNAGQVIAFTALPLTVVAVWLAFGLPGQ